MDIGYKVFKKKKNTIIKMLKHLRGTANNMYEHKGTFRKEMENRRKYENEMLPLKAVSQSVQSLSRVRLFATP